LKGHNWGVCRLYNKNHGKHPKGMLNKKHSKQTKECISKAMSGKNHPLYGKKGKENPFYGKHHTEKLKKYFSKLFSDRNGKKNPMYGKHHSKKTRDLLRKNHLGRSCFWLKGKQLPKKQKEKMSIAKIGNLNPNWNGGISFEPYGLEFNKQLKGQIRERDNFICQECKQTQERLGYLLNVHHIDYNKKNNNPANLISLCKTCHSQTNHNREHWTPLLKKLI